MNNIARRQIFVTEIQLNVDRAFPGRFNWILHASLNSFRQVVAKVGNVLAVDNMLKVL